MDLVHWYKVGVVGEMLELDGKLGGQVRHMTEWVKLKFDTYLLVRDCQTETCYIGDHAHEELNGEWCNQEMEKYMSGNHYL